MQKLRIKRKDKVTAFNKHHPLGAYLLSKNFQAEASKQWNSKLLGKIGL